MRRFVVAFLLAALVAIPVLAEEVGAELQASVPALSALHEVVGPLWHDAWPNKDYALIRSSLPNLARGVEAVAAAKLPGILRDKAADWKAGVATLEKAVSDTGKSAAANDEKGMLDGVEAVHSAFEALVRVVKPPMKELDAYHQVLYTLYHKALPAGDVVAMREAAEELDFRCEALVAAPLPRRATGREQAVKDALAALCKSTAELRALPAETGREAMAAAVEKTHTAYQAAEAAFETK